MLKRSLDRKSDYRLKLQSSSKRGTNLAHYCKCPYAASMTPCIGQAMLCLRVLTEVWYKCQSKRTKQEKRPYRTRDAPELAKKMISYKILQSIVISYMSLQNKNNQHALQKMEKSSKTTK